MEKMEDQVSTNSKYREGQSKKETPNLLEGALVKSIQEHEKKTHLELGCFSLAEALEALVIFVKLRLLQLVQKKRVGRGEIGFID